MKKIISIVVSLALLAVATTATVSAHTAVAECGGFLTLAKGSSTADITRTSDNPDTLVYDNVPGNGKYAVTPGTYKVVWSDDFKIKDLVVTECNQPTPTPTPTPTPEVTPTPTPEVTPTPTPTLTPTPIVSSFDCEEVGGFGRFNVVGWTPEFTIRVIRPDGDTFFTRDGDFLNFPPGVYVVVITRGEQEISRGEFSIGDCPEEEPTPTPSETPTPEPTPNPTPSPTPEVTPTPRPTLPPTDTE